MEAKETVSQPTYVLRTCAADMSAYGGFIWPESGLVEASDWNPKAVCGYGLHGLLMGDGDYSHLSFAEDAKWLVVAVAPDALVDLDGKVKFPRGDVVFCGDMKGAAEFIIAKGADPGKVPGGTATAGDSGTATAGYGGTATAGDSGTATAGDSGTATAGNRGTATAGNRGTATAGDSGTATAGYRGTATAGDSGTATAGYGGTATAGYGGTATAGDSGTATAGYGGTATAGDSGTATAGDSGTATAGNRGTATAGYGGTATAGDSGTATAGNRGTATAGDSGTATAGEDGVLVIMRWNGKRYKLVVANVGENGIEPNKPYRLDDEGAFVPVVVENEEAS